MTPDKTPSDSDLQERCAEIVEWQRTGVLPGNALRNYAAKHWAGHTDALQMAERDTSALAMEQIAKWGSPVVAVEPVKPDFYTACGRQECGLVPLPAYSNATEQGVMNLVLEAARREGYKGAAAERLLELGWVIRPVYLAPQPTQAQAGAVKHGD